MRTKDTPTQYQSRGRKMATLQPEHHATISALAKKNRTSIEAELDKLLTRAFSVRHIPILGEVKS